MKVIENRLIELETRAAFQEETLHTLDGVIVRQQEEINQLNKQVAQLKKQMENITPSLLTQVTEEEPPPHY